MAASTLSPSQFPNTLSAEKNSNFKNNFRLLLVIFINGVIGHERLLQREEEIWYFKAKIIKENSKAKAFSFLRFRRRPAPGSCLSWFSRTSRSHLLTFSSLFAYIFLYFVKTICVFTKIPTYLFDNKSHPKLVKTSETLICNLLPLNNLRTLDSFLK